MMMLIILITATIRRFSRGGHTGHASTISDQTDVSCRFLKQPLTKP